METFARFSVIPRRLDLPAHGEILTFFREAEEIRQKILFDKPSVTVVSAGRVSQSPQRFFDRSHFADIDTVRSPLFQFQGVVFEPGFRPEETKSFSMKTQLSIDM